MRKYIFIAVSLLAILSCVKESVAPEQRITGIFALDDGSGLSDEYIEFKNGYLTTYSLRPKQKTFAEGKFWNASENDFYLDIAGRYSIIEDDLKAEGKSRGKISISEDALKIGESTYTRVKGFESDHYSVIKPERTIVSVPYVQTTNTVACSISRPIPAGTAGVKSKPDFVSSASFDGENLIFTVDQTKADRSGKIVLTYTNAEDVEIEVKQEQQTFIILPSTSAEVSYQAGTGQFSFSIENPVEGDALSAQCESDWVHDLSVDGDNVSFSYEGNNTSAARTAVITCSCSGAKAVSFTLAQSGMPVTNLTLNKTSLAMNVGTSETLVATVTPPGATLLWSGTNTTVATVDSNGKVTAKANGTATITAKTVDGSKTATCAVTVTTAVTGISLNKTTLSLYVGSSKTLVATVAPSTASNKAVTWTSSSTSIATVDGNGKVTAKAKGSATITVKTVDGAKTATCAVTVKPAPAGAVDLGLSVYWATCNLGASKPEDYGDYYAWGATEPWYKDGYAQSSSPQWKSGKSGGYTWENCPYYTGSHKWTKYVPSAKSLYWGGSGWPDNKTVLEPEDDAAHVNLSGNWRMPTKEEFDELANTSNCSWTWTTLNGINGYKVQSKKSGYTDNWIFLPAAGFRSGEFLLWSERGYYWSSSLNTADPISAWGLYLNSNTSSTYRDYGQSVRPVTE